MSDLFPDPLAAGQGGESAATRLARRVFLTRATGMSLGGLALGELLPSRPVRGADGPPSNRVLENSVLDTVRQQFAPTARRVIFLTQSGGPSQLELYDHKPGLAEWAGKELPESVRQGQRLTTMTASRNTTRVIRSDSLYMALPFQLFGQVRKGRNDI